MDYALEEIKMPDWAALWDETIRSSSWYQEVLEQAPTMTEYWNKHAPKYGKADAASPSPILQRIESLVTPEMEILDVGAGTGAFTIPLAKKAKSVTAVEPSAGMLGFLEDRAVKEGLNNIQTLNKKWDEVDLGCTYDLVLSTNALPFMDNIKKVLRKMLDATSGSLWLGTIASNPDDVLAKIWSIVREAPHVPGPDYSWLYQILRGFGVHPNVEIFSTDRRFTNMDEAVKFMSTHCAEGAITGKEAALRILISKYVTSSEDGSFLWKRVFNTALFSLHKGEIL